MSACEKCWVEAVNSYARYLELLGLHQCTLEEQAGPYSAKCAHCQRMTVHQYSGEPMCGCGP